MRGACDEAIQKKARTKTFQSNCHAGLDPASIQPGINTHKQRKTTISQVLTKPTAKSNMIKNWKNFDNMKTSLLEFIKQHFITILVIIIAFIVIIHFKDFIWSKLLKPYPTFTLNEIKGNKEIAQIFIASREYMIKILTVIGGFIGIGIGFWRLIIADRNHKQQIKQEINERYAKAVELLGHESEAVRIGGLYSLEQISKNIDYKDINYNKICLDVVAAFVRNEVSTDRTKKEKEKWQFECKGIKTYNKKNTSKKQEYPSLYLHEDIKTAIYILSRREKKPEKIRLKNLDWEGIDLKNTGIKFSELDFSDSNFNLIKLKGDFSTCDFSKVKFNGADLSEAKLTFEQLKIAIINEDTKLSNDLEKHRKELLESSRRVGFNPPVQSEKR